MAPFPPIFAYVIFFILDFIAFILDITVVASIAGVFISFLTTFLYILWVFFRYGPGKAAENLFNLKQKAAKKIVKIFGGSVIPFVNVWAVYDDYKQEMREYRNKEKGTSENVEPDKKQEVDKQLAQARARSEGAETEESLMNRRYGGPDKRLAQARARSEGAETEESLMNRRYGGPDKRLAQARARSEGAETEESLRRRKTIEEEVGGVKTGLNKEDYDSGIKNYGDFDTYTKENKENEENKRQKQEEARKNDEAKRIQGIKADQDLRTEMLDTAKRRYGENSDEAKRGKEEEDSNHSNDDYREII